MAATAGDVAALAGAEELAAAELGRTLAEAPGVEVPVGGGEFRRTRGRKE